MEGESEDVTPSGSGETPHEYKCVVCWWDVGSETNVSRVYSTGYGTLMDSCRRRGDVEVESRLTTIPLGKLFIHNRCRKEYTDKRKIDAIASSDAGGVNEGRSST
jgi:hypothetical protein